MQKKLPIFQILIAFTLSCLLSTHLKAQATLEWRLANVLYDNTDPDGAGLARGSVKFTLQIHAISGTANNVNVISTGYSYQSTLAMVPTGSAGPGCPSTVNNPANVTVSPAFVAANFSYTTVNQCGLFLQTVGGQIFDSRAVGTLDGAGINITTEWMDVFTVTLWSLNQLETTAGFAIINSGSGGTPGEFPTYSASGVVGVDVIEYPVNSLSYSTPVLLPISLSAFDVACTNKGANVNWETLSEPNNSFFEVERSSDGVNGWTSTGNMKAAGNAHLGKRYNFMDLKGGTAYYRLKQVDKDGAFTYSKIEKANCASKQLDLIVYPVPAKNILNVVVGADKNSKATLQLVDVTGKSVRQINTDLLKGNNNLKLNISGLARGEYFLRVLGLETVRTHKVTIN